MDERIPSSQLFHLGVGRKYALGLLGLGEITFVNT